MKYFTNRKQVLIRSAIWAIGLASSLSAQATLRFEFYLASDEATQNTFVSDPLGASRLEAVKQSANMFSDMFDDYFSNTATLRFELATAKDARTLASASSNAEMVSDSASGFVDSDAALVAKGGIALPGKPNGFININFAQPYELSATTPVATDKWDFYSTMSHEILHALGFVSSLDGAGPASEGPYTTFDRFLSNKDGKHLFSASPVGADPTVWADVLASGLYFNGPNAVAANGGKLVPLYSPKTYEEGSSYSHFDFFTSGLMMTPSDEMGPNPRIMSPFEVAVFTDLGYTRVSAVPEADAITLLALGLLSTLALRAKSARNRQNA